MFNFQKANSGNSSFLCFHKIYLISIRYILFHKLYITRVIPNNNSVFKDLLVLTVFQLSVLLVVLTASSAFDLKLCRHLWLVLDADVKQPLQNSDWSTLGLLLVVLWINWCSYGPGKLVKLLHLINW